MQRHSRLCLALVCAAGLLLALVSGCTVPPSESASPAPPSTPATLSTEPGTVGPNEGDYRPSANDLLLDVRVDSVDSGLATVTVELRNITDAPLVFLPEQAVCRLAVRRPGEASPSIVTSVAVGYQGWGDPVSAKRRLTIWPYEFLTGTATLRLTGADLFTVVGSMPAIPGVESMPTRAAVRGDLSGTLEDGEYASSFDADGWGTAGTVSGAVSEFASADPTRAISSRCTCAEGERLDANVYCRANSGIRLVARAPDARGRATGVGNGTADSGRQRAPLAASAAAGRDAGRSWLTGLAGLLERDSIPLDGHGVMDYVAPSAGVYVPSRVQRGQHSARQSRMQLNWTVDSDLRIARTWVQESPACGAEHGPRGRSGSRRPCGRLRRERQEGPVTGGTG